MRTGYGDYTDDMSSRAGVRDRRLRASDADREATATTLRRHYTEGRLDAQEYDERIERCYAAKTFGELDELFGDLPRAEPRGPEMSRMERGFRPSWRLAAIVPVVAALIVLSILTGAHVVWFAWPLFFLFFGPFGRWRRHDFEYRGRHEDGRTAA